MHPDKINQIGSILAYNDGGPGSEDVVRTAILYGQAFSAHVEVLHVENEIDPCNLFSGSVMDAGATSELVNLMKHEAENQAASARKVFEKVRQGLLNGDKEIDLSYNQVSGHEARELAHRGRFFDLIIMAKAQRQAGGVDSAQLEAALLDTGRPVLIIGDDVPASIAATIVIAWDGSREAAHSVKLSLPILSKAQGVHILSVGDCVPGTGPEQLSQYLAVHGIECETYKKDRQEEAIASTLMTMSRNKGANLLIMGAYGHSPLSESLFGGVTRDMLEAGSIPLLMAH